jgi:hypothetical protein
MIAWGTMIVRLYVWALNALPSPIPFVVTCPAGDALCVTDQPSSSPIRSTGIDKTTWGVGLGLLALVAGMGVHGFVSASRDAARLAAEAARTPKEQYDDLDGRQ